MKPLARTASASTERAAELLDFTAATPIQEGLRQFVAWLNRTHPVQG